MSVQYLAIHPKEWHSTLHLGKGLAIELFWLKDCRFEIYIRPGEYSSLRYGCPLPKVFIYQYRPPLPFPRARVVLYVIYEPPPVPAKPNASRSGKAIIFLSSLFSFPSPLLLSLTPLPLTSYSSGALHHPPVPLSHCDPLPPSIPPRTPHFLLSPTFVASSNHLALAPPHTYTLLTLPTTYQYTCGFCFTTF